MGAIGITVSHELIHKDPQLEQNAGGLLLAAVCYACLLYTSSVRSCAMRSAAAWVSVMVGVRETKRAASAAL